MRWVQKCETDDEPLPVPVQAVSNEEFEPLPQTEEQKRVAQKLSEIADFSIKKLGVSRREFLASTGGLAAAFLAMNSVFGDLFSVSASELFEPLASEEKWPKKPFIFEIHTHNVAAPKIIRKSGGVPSIVAMRASWRSRSGVERSSPAV